MSKYLGLRTGGEGSLFLEIANTGSCVGVGEEEWCELVLELKNCNMELSIGGEIITNVEIKQIANNLKKVLDKKIEDVVVFETMEPYLKFVFSEDCIRLNISFSYSMDYYSLYLDKYNIKKLYEFLVSID